MAVSPRLPVSLNTYRDLDITTSQCWSILFDGMLIDKPFIDAIEDSDLSGRMMTSSIPNPLARLYMFKNAFEYFVEDRNRERFNNDNPYAGLVSDSLDLLQLLFENRDTERIRVADWNITSQLEKLSRSNNVKHQKFADALKLYFDRDDDLKNFNTIQLIYYHTNSGADILIGGTSPFTYVYTSPNWKRAILENDISDDLLSYDNNGDRDNFFDADFRSFEMRQTDFRDYLILLAGLDGNSSIANYVLRCSGGRNPEINLNGQPVKYKTKANDDSYPDGVSLKLSSSEIFLKQTVNVQTADSNFIIAAKSLRYRNKKEMYSVEEPIVYAKSLDYNGRIYGNYNYNRNEDPPQYIMGMPVCERNIPGAPGIKYPIILEQDFFTDELLKLPYDVDTSNSFYGPIQNSNSIGYRYLLPIKPLFFDFFDAQNINELLEFRIDGESVLFILRVPVKGSLGAVTFIKRYSKNKQRELNFGMSLFPKVRYVEGRKKTPVGNSYNIMVFNDDPDQNSNPQYDTINYYSYASKEELQQITNVVQKDRCSNMNYGFSQHFHIPEAFDVIEVVSTDGASGLILPKFMVTEGGTNSFFASIDFGTSNTFVACQYGDKEPEPLSFSSNMIANLNKDTDAYGSIKQGMVKSLKTEFIPASIETNSVNNDQISFPISTIMSVDTSERHISDQNLKRLFLYSNIGFYADKETDAYKSDQNKFKFISNIKPLFELNPSGDYKVHVENFLEEILWLIKCKAIETQVDFNELKIIWTYPSSGRFRSSLESIFPVICEKVFGVNNKKSLIVSANKSLSESLAPFIYIQKLKENIDSTGNFLNIDIGGGTTDIVCNFEKYTDGTIRRNYKITSVKFAGNDLWGCGIAGEGSTNSFIDAWEDVNSDSIESADSSSNEFLRYKALNERGKVSGADSRVSATDKINLLFKYNSRLEFTSIFSNKKDNKDLLKFPLFFHFTSILHYTLCWMRLIDIEEYNTVSFTGKGSSYLSIIFSDNVLESFIQTYVDEYNSLNNTSIKISNIKLWPNPKEITAYGAISHLKDNYKNEYEVEIKHFLPKVANESGGGARGRSNQKLDISQLEKDCLKELENIEKILFESEQMYLILKELFDVDIISDSLFNLKNNLFFKMAKSSFVNSVQLYNEEKNDTVFFYAFKDSLYKLTNHIYDQCRTLK